MKNKKHIKPPFLSTSFSESGKKLRTRIENILNTKKRRTGAIMLLVIFAAALLFGGFVVFSRSSAPTEQPEPIRPVAVVGNDGRGMSDIILVLEWDDKSNTLEVIQIPRDVRSSSGGKIGTSYGEGTLLDELRLLGYDAGGVVSVSYEAFRGAVDAIGGVELDVPIDMWYSDPEQGLEIDLKSGEQTLDGEHAEMLIRYRKDNSGSGYVNGDLDRLVVQNGFYSSFLDKFLNTELSDEVFSSLISSLDTDMSAGEIARYVELMGRIENINITLLPGQQEIAEGVTYFVPSQE